jgi:hypothetical protein
MPSPRFPVRLSTLILSCRNFSNADGSKILSFVGAEASRTYYTDQHWHGKWALFGIVFSRRVCLISRESAYCFFWKNSKATGVGSVLSSERVPCRLMMVVMGEIEDRNLRRWICDCHYGKVFRATYLLNKVALNIQLRAQYRGPPISSRGGH